MRFVKWLAILGMTLSFPLGAFAALDLGASGLSTAGTNAGISTTGTEGSLGSLVGMIIGAVLNIMGVLLFIYFVYAGFLWMTAQGDEKQVKKAKDIMGNAVAGLLLVMLAFSITLFVMDEVGGMSILGFDLFDQTVTEAGFTADNALLLDNIGGIIATILNLLGVVLFLIFVYAGWLWMSAAGDSKQTGKAKDMMKNAVIGLIIILSARVIAGFVIERMGSEGAGLTLREQVAPIHNVRGA